MQFLPNATFPQNQKSHKARILCMSFNSCNALCVFNVMGMHYDRVTIIDDIGKTGKTTVLPIFDGYENKTFFFSFLSTRYLIAMRAK